jgi:hypothetical protein
VVRDRSDLLILASGAVGIVLLAAVLVFAQPAPNGGGGQSGGNGPQGGSGQQAGHSGGPPVYQRQGSGWGWQDNRRGGRREGFNRYAPGMMPQVSSGWFQRPYPYHLDYYKMRYGGSYAPYFGNLYGVPFGTPQVVNGGGGDWGGGGGGGYPVPGYEWMDGPRPPQPGKGVIFESQAAAQPIEVTPNGGGQSSGENLPAPSK